MPRNYYEIMGTTNMSASPEFYAGRGEGSGDLESKNLEKIYQCINQDYGDKSAKDFVNMVYQLPDVSASTFLISFQRFCQNGFQYKETQKVKDANEAFDETIANDFRKNDDHVTGAGLMGVYHRMMASTNDITGSESTKRRIIGDFILNHKDELDLPAEEKKQVLNKMRYGLS